MRLSRTLTVMAALLLGTTVLSLLALVLLTDQLALSNQRIVEGLEGAQAAGDLQLAVLRHRREVLVWALTGDRRHQRHALEAMSVARTLVDRLEAQGDPEAAAALARVEEALLEYRQAQLDSDLEPDEPRDEVLGDYQATSPALDRLIEAAEAVQGLYRRRAAEARAAAERVNRLSNLGAATVSLLMVGVTVLFLVRVVRRLYAPLPALQATMSRLQQGHLSARAPLDGPEELRLIAEGVNTLAAELQTQRRERLAFLAAVAHDLRNPLTSLRLHAHLARPDRPLPPEDVVRRFYAQVARQVDLLARQVGDLLDLARLEAGEISLERKRVEVGELCRKVLDLLSPTAPEHELALAGDDRLAVEGDEARLEQVLTNLVSNAIKYSPGGGRVEVRLSRRRERAVVEVADEGIGIAPADLETLFRPFQRSAQVGDIPGTGLGLSAARRIVEAHGGAIEVESAPGRGSTFRVLLPDPEAA